MKDLVRFLAVLGTLATLLPGMARAVVADLPLTRFLPYPSLEMRCTQDERAIEVSIPERWKVNSATLKIHYQISPSVIGRLSNIVVKLNDVPIGHSLLKPVGITDPFTVEIPARLLTSGYNRLSFTIAQHRQEKDCEAPCSSDMWTSIKLDTSSLKIDYDLRPVPMQIGALSNFTFDPKISPAGKVHLVFNTTEEQSVSIATAVASGIARRFDYRKVTFTVADVMKPGVDNVIIGTTAFVRQVLGPDAPPPPKEKGGVLKILPMPAVDGSPANPNYALALVSGNTLEEVKLAAFTIANLSLTYPSSDEMRATGFSLPDIEAYGGRNIISADRAYDFKTLNLPTRTMVGLNPLASEINFRLPADFLIKQNRTVELVLNFAYGGGMRPDSTLNVLVNGIAVRAIALEKPDGGFFEKYKLEIPTYVFRPGDNAITFSPQLHAGGKECELLQFGNLFLTIFDNSTLKFPYMPHFVEMPKMELFMLNGFPFTRWPDGFEGLIYIARPSVDSLAAMMNLVGMMTQKNGFPLINLQVTYKPPEGVNGDLIVFGDVFSLPEKFANASPLRVGKTSMVPYPIIRSWQNESTFAYSQQISKMGSKRALMMEFESPLQPGRSVLLFAAEDQADLSLLTEKLLDAEVQSQVFGDLSLFDFTGEKPKVTSVKTGKIYTTGKQGKVSWLDTASDQFDSLMYARPWVFYSVLSILIGLLTWMLYKMVKRYRIQRLLTVSGKKTANK